MSRTEGEPTGASQAPAAKTDVPALAITVEVKGALDEVGLGDASVKPTAPETEKMLMIRTEFETFAAKLIAMAQHANFQEVMAEVAAAKARYQEDPTITLGGRTICRQVETQGGGMVVLLWNTGKIQIDGVPSAEVKES